MKRLRWILLLCLAASPAWSAKSNKITILELRDLLSNLQQAKKADGDIALELKKIELSEELTPATMNSLASFLPGPLSTEQVYVLRARSATLPAPASDRPTDPAPDAATQKELLSKASDYVARTYSQLPHLVANRMVARFQDGVEAVHSYSGMNHGSSEDSDPLWQTTNLDIRLVNTSKSSVESINGQEKPSTTRDKTNWGANNLITPVTPPLPLATLIQEATESGAPRFDRWELVNNRKAAVFDYSIDRKKTRFAVNYCCFPTTDTTGLLSNGITGISSGVSSGGSGNLQSVSEWKPFKTAAGYHGEIFIDAELGIVLRTITAGDFKKTDFVHAESVRTDFSAIPIANKTLVVPVQTFILAEIVPNGDSFAAHYAIRHMYITQTYSDYQLVGATTTH